MESKRAAFGAFVEERFGSDPVFSAVAVTSSLHSTRVDFVLRGIARRLWFVVTPLTQEEIASLRISTFCFFGVCPPLRAFEQLWHSEMRPARMITTIARSLEPSWRGDNSSEWIPFVDPCFSQSPFFAVGYDVVNYQALWGYPSRDAEAGAEAAPLIVEFSERS